MKAIIVLLLLAACPSSVAFADEESPKIKQRREAVKTDPKDSNAHYNLGLALMRSIEASLRGEAGLNAAEAKVAEEAARCFKTAISLSNNTHGRALTMLGWLYKLQHQYDK